MIPNLRRYQAAATIALQSGFGVMLDSVPLQTPAKAVLQLPTQALADAIAAEWNAQLREIKPSTMPLTQLAMTAQDRLVNVDDLLGWLSGDLIAYYADSAELRAIEAQHWQPVHDWLWQRFGASLPQTHGVLPNREPVTVGTIRNYLQALDQFRLMGLRELAATLNSVSLALALVEGSLSINAAVTAAEIDSLQQMQRWGEDRDIMRQHTAVRNEVTMLLQFLALFG